MSRNLAASIRARLKQRADVAKQDFNLTHSQTLLGHKNRDMTKHDVKARTGERVKPLR